MELLQLQYFVEVARLESFTRASQSLHVSQPALSQTVKRLENEVGVKLFEREGKHIKLTAHGRKFFARIGHSLQEIQAACSDLKNQRLQGNITIGTYMPIQPILPCLDAFSQENPDVTYSLMYVMNSHEVSAKALDALLYYEISNSMNFSENVFIGNTRGIFSVPVNAALDMEGNLDLTDLEEYDFVSLTNDDGWLEELLENYSYGGRAPNIRYRTNSMMIKQEIMEAGLAVGSTNILLQPRMRDTGKYKIVHKAAAGRKKLPMYLAWRNTNYLPEAAIALKEFSAKWFSDPSHLTESDLE